MAADNGVVSCLDAKTGKTQWIERVASTCSPSMLHAVGKIFLSDETGKTFIFEAKAKYSLLATNDLQEKMLASPIAYQTSMIIRTEKNLWRIDP
jgi:outer membrane protein assembly factor BamB